VAEFTFDEVEDGFAIFADSGTILICKCGEGATGFPIGTALLSRVLGGDEVALSNRPIPLDEFWQDLASARPSPEFVYWLHPVDYGAAVRLFKSRMLPSRDDHLTIM
jgi:hypothetical protein